MRYDFTDRTRKVLKFARDEAIALQHDYVGTEHILLGLIREGEGVAVATLLNLNANPEQIRERTLDSIRKGKGSFNLGELPYTTRAKHVLEYAMAEARELSHSYIGTEHLLLGLLREEKGIAGQVLMASGVTLDAVRRETLTLLGSEQATAEVAREPSARSLSPRDRPQDSQPNQAAHDQDLAGKSREELIAEVRKLRQGIRQHRDSTGHGLCWHHPQLWGLLPEQEHPIPEVPEWPQFLRGCIAYRLSLDEQLPDAPRTSRPYDANER